MTPRPTSLVSVVLALALLLAPVTIHCGQCGTALWEMTGGQCAAAHATPSAADARSELASGGCPHCAAQQEQAANGGPTWHSPTRCGCDKTAGLSARAVESVRVAVPDDVRLVDVLIAFASTEAAADVVKRTEAREGGGGAAPMPCVVCVWRN